MTYWILITESTTGGENFYWAKGYLSFAQGLIIQPTGAEIKSSQ